MRTSAPEEVRLASFKFVVGAKNDICLPFDDESGNPTT